VQTKNQWVLPLFHSLLGLSLFFLSPFFTISKPLNYGAAAATSTSTSLVVFEINLLNMGGKDENPRCSFFLSLFNAPLREVHVVGAAIRQVLPHNCMACSLWC
jgi:hypothetical protein